MQRINEIISYIVLLPPEIFLFIQYWNQFKLNTWEYITVLTVIRKINVK